MSLTFGFSIRYCHRLSLMAAGTLLAFSLGAGVAQAQTYPAKPIKIVLMFPPGGASDGSMRLIAERLKPVLGQPVLVDNRPGAGGIVAADAVRTSAADGYTLLHSGMTLMTLTPKFNVSARYSQNDFVPVASIAVTPPLLIARSDFPANDVKGLIELARRKPGELSYGTWGLGSVTHVAGEWLDRQAGTKLTPIPYKGEVPVMQDLLGGQLPLGWVTLPALLPHLQAGKLKVLGVASAQREPLLPGVPTFVEQGVPNFVISNWIGVFAPQGTSKEVVALLNTRIRDVLKQPDVHERLSSQGLTVLSLSSEQFGELVKADAARLGPMLDLLAPAIRQ